MSEQSETKFDIDSYRYRYFLMCRRDEEWRCDPDENIHDDGCHVPAVQALIDEIDRLNGRSTNNA